MYVRALLFGNYAHSGLFHNRTICGSSRRFSARIIKLKRSAQALRSSSVEKEQYMRSAPTPTSITRPQYACDETRACSRGREKLIVFVKDGITTTNR